MYTISHLGAKDVVLDHLGANGLAADIPDLKRDVDVAGKDDSPQEEV